MWCAHDTPPEIGVAIGSIMPGAGTVLGAAVGGRNPRRPLPAAVPDDTHRDCRFVLMEFGISTPALLKSDERRDGFEAPRSRAKIVSSAFSPTIRPGIKRSVSGHRRRTPVAVRPRTRLPRGPRMTRGRSWCRCWMGSGAGRVRTARRPRLRPRPRPTEHGRHGELAAPCLLRPAEIVVPAIFFDFEDTARATLHRHVLSNAQWGPRGGRCDLGCPRGCLAEQPRGLYCVRQIAKEDHLVRGRFLCLDALRKSTPPKTS